MVERVIKTWATPVNGTSSSRLGSNTMDQYLVYNTEFQVAICTSCEYAVCGDVARHFKDNHKETWKAYRKELKAHVKAMALATRSQVLNAYPEAYEARGPVPGIAVQDGWVCMEDECSHLSINDSTMSQHCRVEHGWDTRQGGNMWTECRVQSLFGRPYVK